MTEFFGDKTAKNAENAERAEKRNEGLLLRWAASCDQADLRTSNQVSMAMISVSVIGDLPNLRTQFLDVFHKFFPLRSLRSLRFIPFGNCGRASRGPPIQ